MSCPFTWLFCEVLEDSMVLPALAGSFSDLHKKLYSVFRGQNGIWIKHKSQSVFDAPHVCFARSLSWDWHQSAETRSCTDWQKQQKDQLLLGEKPLVVNMIFVEMAVFHLADLCIQLNFWGDLKKGFVVRKTRLSFCSTNTREAE